MYQFELKLQLIRR